MTDYDRCALASLAAYLTENPRKQKSLGQIVRYFGWADEDHARSAMRHALAMMEGRGLTQVKDGLDSLGLQAEASKRPLSRVESGAKPPGENDDGRFPPDPLVDWSMSQCGCIRGGSGCRGSPELSLTR